MDLEKKGMKDHGLKIKCKVLEFIITHVELSIMESGKTINIMEKEFINFQTVQYTKENGEIT